MAQGKFDDPTQIMTEKDRKNWQEELESFLKQLVEVTTFNNNPKFYGLTAKDPRTDYQKRWEHWIRKLMQLGVLEDVFSLENESIPFKDMPESQQPNAPEFIIALKNRKFQFKITNDLYRRILTYLVDKLAVKAFV